MFADLKLIPGSPWTPLALAGGLALLDAIAVEPNLLSVRRVDVAVDPRHRPLAGLKIAQLSDLHVGGGGWRWSTVARAVDACNQEDVDLVAITGDFIGRERGVDAALDLLASLRADIPRLAVLGNHDHAYGKRPLEKLLAGLRALGVTLLRNQAAPVELPSGRVWFVGVDDGYSMRDDLARAMRGLGPEDFPRILLTHYPDVADQLRPGQAQLSLAGHTHAGQIRLPVLTRLVNNGHARTKYSYGPYLVNGNPLYITSGVGMSGVPMRFRNWPEVAILHLSAISHQLSASSFELAAISNQPSIVGRRASAGGNREDGHDRNGRTHAVSARVPTTES